MSNEISKSKQKRQKQLKARQEQRQKKALRIFLAIAIPLIIIAAIVGSVLYYNYTKFDYGKFLNADGTIQLANLPEAPYIDYKSMSFNKVDLLPDDETVDSDIANTLAAYPQISSDMSLVIEENSKVNIAYDAKIGDAIYNSVAEDVGTDLTIGYETLSIDVDTALIGHKVGDTVTVSTTYSVDDANTALAGQTVDYTIKVLGIYETPELTDEFVITNLSDTASTAAEYRQSIIDDYYHTNLETAIQEYIKTNMVVNYIPDNFVANLQKIYDKQNIAQMNYMNEMYYSYFQTNVYDSVYSMLGFETEDEYKNSIYTSAIDDTRYSMILQYIYQNENLTNTEEDVKAYFFAQGYDEAGYYDLVNEYGASYLAHMALNDRMLEYLCDTVTVNE